MPTDFCFNSYDRKGDGKIKGVVSIPRLLAEARSEVHTHWSPTKLLFQMDSSATAYGSTISKRVAWRYGMCPFHPVSPFQGSVCLRVKTMRRANIIDGHVTCAFSDNEKIEFNWNTGTNVDTKKVASYFPVDLSSYPRTLHEYANRLLDQRVPQTDMTFRHMGSKLTAVSMTLRQNKWMAIDANCLNNWARCRNIQKDISKAWVASFPSTQSCIEQISNGRH